MNLYADDSNLKLSKSWTRNDKPVVERRAMLKSVYHTHKLKLVLVEVNDSISKNNFDELFKL